MRRPMHRPSTVDKLDPEIRKLIADLRLEHGWSIDQIKAKLDELKQPVSRSALARHTKSIEEIGREMRHSREMAKALLEQAAPGEDAKVADLNIELMHTMILRLVTATEGGEMVSLDPKDVMFLTSSLSSLAGARKTDAERRRKDRADAKKELMEKVREVASTKGSGMSKATVDLIAAKVLGAE